MRNFPFLLLCLITEGYTFRCRQVIWALRLLIKWSMHGILCLIWIRTSMRIWLLAVRYMPHWCSHYRVRTAVLLTMPAGFGLTLILFSHDICMVISPDEPCLKRVARAFSFFLNTRISRYTFATSNFAVPD